LKIIALDMDGTLVNPDGTIAPQSISELQRLADDGVVIAIATGRPLQFVLPTLEENHICPELGYPQVIITDERDVHFLDGSEYRPWHSHNAAAYNKEIALLDLACELTRQLSQDIEQFFFVNNDYMQQSRGYVEMLFRRDAVRDAAISWFEKELEGKGTLRAVRNRQLVALRHVDTGKGWALEKVASHFGASFKEVLAVGDSYNDYDMLSRDFKAATTDNAHSGIKQLVRKRDGVVAASGYSLGVAQILQPLGRQSSPLRP